MAGCHILLVVLFLSVALVNSIRWKPVVTLAQFVYHTTFSSHKKKKNIKSYVVAVLLIPFITRSVCFTWKAHVLL